MTPLYFFTCNLTFVIFLRIKLCGRTCSIMLSWLTHSCFYPIVNKMLCAGIILSVRLSWVCRVMETFTSEMSWWSSTRSRKIVHAALTRCARLLLKTRYTTSRNDSVLIRRMSLEWSVLESRTFALALLSEGGSYFFMAVKFPVSVDKLYKCSNVKSNRLVEFNQFVING